MSTMTRSTSREAWQSVTDSGLVSSMRLRVYDWLYRNGPSTRSEVDIGLRGPGEVNPSYHKRLSELERQGLVESVSERPCRITGRNCIAWQTTDLCMPRPLPKAKKSKAKTIEELDSLIDRVIDWLENQNGDIRKSHAELAAKKLRARRNGIIPKEGKDENDSNGNK